MCRRHFTVVATIVLFFLFCFLPQPEINIDLALEDALKHHLALLIDSDSARRIRAIQTSLLPPKYPRNLKFTDIYTPEHIARACTTLRAKKILLVGPEPTYYLHSLWLRAIELHEHAIHECPGPEFCTFHHICCPPTQHTTPVITRDRVKHPPRDADLRTTRSALLRYVLSTSLLAALDKNDPRYTRVIIDPATGVRTKNAYWLRQARKADVVVLNRGPIPAPVETYAGNWSFADHGRTLRTRLMRAALHATTHRFIPEVLATLHTLQSDPLIGSRATLVWHASWYALGGYEPQGKVDDPWAFYYNVQVYMQNHLLRALLPHYGVYFLDLPSIAPDTKVHSSADGPRDTLRAQLGTIAAQSMERAFLRNLVALLERVK